MKKQQSHKMINITGGAVCLLGTVLFLTYPIFLFAPKITHTIIFSNTILYYSLATAGCFAFSLGLIFLNTQKNGVTFQAITLSAAVGFAMLAYIRLITLILAPVDFNALRGPILGETIAFFTLAVLFYKAGLKGMPLADVKNTLRAAATGENLKVWVRIWLFLGLGPVQWLSFVFIGHPIGLATALAMCFVVLSNVCLVVLERGISRATSIPHLMVWIPLQIYVGVWLFTSYFGTIELGDPIFYYAWLVFTIHGISIIFDVIEAYHWFRNERAVLTV